MLVRLFRLLPEQLRSDEMRRSILITDAVKLPVINPLYGAITMNKGIDP